MTDIEKRKEDLEFIINRLENDEAFRKVVEDKRATIALCDNSWHHIDLSDKDKLLELKYAKHAAESIVNTIDIYKQELTSLKQQEEPMGYMDDD